MRSAWRGEPRGMMPNRSVSYRLAPVAIISMAQHARPNCMNQMLFLRLQLMSWSAVAKRIPSPKRSWIGPPIGNGFPGPDPGGASGLVSDLISDMPSSAPVLGAHPGEVALPPDVREGDHQDAYKEEPLEVREGSQVAEDDRPGQQEHGFHVEDEKDEGEHVEADVELH